MEAESRDVMDGDAKTVDMGNKRATDLQNNRNVFMPGPGPAPVEAEYETRYSVWMSDFRSYFKDNFNDKGRQKVTNLSIEQEMAVKSLGKKISRGEIVILKADKGKRFVATDLPTYKAMASDHTSIDKEVKPERVA